MFELFLTIPAALLASYIGITYFTGTNFEIVEVRVADALVEKGYGEDPLAERIEERLNRLDQSVNAIRVLSAPDMASVETGGGITSFFTGMAKAFNEFKEVRITSAYVGLLPNAVTIELFAVNEEDVTMTIKHTAPYIGDDFEPIVVSGSVNDMDGVIDEAVHEFLHENYPYEYFYVILHESVEAALANNSSVSIPAKKAMRKLISHMLVQTPPAHLFDLYSAMAIVEMVDGHYEDAIVRSLQAERYIAEDNPSMVGSLINRALAHELLGNVKRAEELHTQNVESFPQNSLSHVMFGSFLKRMGRLTEAEERYSAGLNLVPDHPRVLALLSDVKLAKGEYFAAATILKDATILDPEDELIKTTLRYAQSMLDPSLAAFHNEEYGDRQTVCLTDLFCVLTKNKAEISQTQN